MNINRRVMMNSDYNSYDSFKELIKIELETHPQSIITQLNESITLLKDNQQSKG